MRDRNDVLFRGTNLSEVLRAKEQMIQATVDRVPEGAFCDNTDEQVIEHVVSALSIEPLAIYEERMQVTPTESQMDVSQWTERNPFGYRGPIHVAAISLTVTIPFTGNPGLWNCKPSSWGGYLPHGLPCAGVLRMTTELPADTKPEDFKRQIDQNIKAIRDHIGYQRAQLDEFDAQLRNSVQTAVAKRRARLGKAADILKVLNIPLAPKPGAPDVSQLPIKRHVVVPLSPPPTGETSYQIDDATYEHILRVIRHEGATFEATRETYITLGEEDLRNIILAHLNGHYEGDAKGEAFRGAGKTDVTIERDNRAAFVAECKLWRGDKQMLAAIDQLLGYLTWRDGKTALVLFNKGVASFAEIQKKLPELATAHPRFASALPAGTAGEWRFRFKSKNDDGRLVTVHVFLFDLFVTKDRR